MAEKPKKKTAKKVVKKSQPRQKKVNKTATPAPEKVTVQKQEKRSKPNVSVTKSLHIIGDLPDNVAAPIAMAANRIILELPDIAHRRISETINGFAVEASISQEPSRYVLTVHSCIHDQTQS